MTAVLTHPDSEALHRHHHPDMAQPAASGIAMAFAASSGTAAQQLTMKPGVPISVAARQTAGMLTPPNSVSPNLPAQVARVRLSSPPPMRIDGDVDLQDAVDHAASQDQPPVPLSKGALSGLESSHSITASMLAKHYLPDIILGHGPVAIRHVMGCLTQSLPGFTRIPPAKARRLVVAALESRHGGGVHGDIIFEKIGWGRWDAHKKGDRPTFHSSYTDSKLSPPGSEFGSYSTSYRDGLPNERKDTCQESCAGSWMPPSSFGGRAEDMSMAGHEADKMSLDGFSAQESDEDDSMTSDSAGDETEEEDWAAIGPDTLRKASLSTAASTSVRRNYNLISIPGPRHDVRRPSVFGSTSGARSPIQSWSASHYARRPSSLLRSPLMKPVDSHVRSPLLKPIDISGGTDQERDAIAALLSMGSM